EVSRIQHHHRRRRRGGLDDQRGSRVRLELGRVSPQGAAGCGDADEGDRETCRTGRLHSDTPPSCAHAYAPHLDNDKLGSHNKLRLSTSRQTWRRDWILPIRTYSTL